MLPWTQVQGGVYRVNRRLSYAVGDGRLTFTTTGARVQVIPQELCELPMLRGFDDVAVLQALADRFVQRELRTGEVITEQGKPADSICLIAHGKVNRIGKASPATRPRSTCWPTATPTAGRRCSSRTTPGRSPPARPRRAPC